MAKSKKKPEKIWTEVVKKGTMFEVGEQKHTVHSSFEVVVNRKTPEKIEVTLQKFTGIYKHKKGGDKKAAIQKLLRFVYRIYKKDQRSLKSAENMLREEELKDLKKMLEEIFVERKS